MVSITSEKKIQDAVTHINDVLSNKHLSSLNKSTWESNVAGSDLVVEDFMTKSKVKTIKTSLDDNLKLRSIPGHASSGHRIFKDNKKVNTDLDHIFSIFDNGTNCYHNQAQNTINSVGKIVENLIDQYAFSHQKYTPSVDADIFEGFYAHPFLKGLFWGSHFDNGELRKKAQDKYDLEIGFGKTYLFDKHKLKSLGIGLDELASLDFEDKIIGSLTHKERLRAFKQTGLIKHINDTNIEDSNSWQDILDQSVDYLELKDNYIQAYLREEKGSGVSDDIACMATAFIDFNDFHGESSRYFKSLMNGANIGDFVDTLTKGTTRYVSEGFDEVLGKFANKLWVEKIKENSDYRQACGISNARLEQILENPQFGLVDENTIVDFIAMSKNPAKSLLYSNRPEINSDAPVEIHSSARRFLQRVKDEKKNISSYTLEQEVFHTLNLIDNLYASNGKTLKKNFEYDVSKLFDEQTVGFNEIPFRLMTDFFDKTVVPTLTSQNRAKAIEYLYINSQN